MKSLFGLLNVHNKNLTVYLFPHKFNIQGVWNEMWMDAITFQSPGTAAGTARERHLTVAAALSSGEYFCGQSTPGSTMLVLRRLPSRYTW